MIIRNSVALVTALGMASLMILLIPVPRVGAATFTGETCSHSGVINKSPDIANCDDLFGDEGGGWFNSSGNLAQTAHAEWDGGSYGVSANVEWACDVGQTKVLTFASANSRAAQINVWWRTGFWGGTYHIAQILVTTDEINMVSDPQFTTPTVPVSCSEPTFGWFPRFERLF
jgi:hypothetical protein